MKPLIWLHAVLLAKSLVEIAGLKYFCKLHIVVETESCD